MLYRCKSRNNGPSTVDVFVLVLYIRALNFHFNEVSPCRRERRGCAVLSRPLFPLEVVFITQISSQFDLWNNRLYALLAPLNKQRSV